MTSREQVRARLGAPELVRFFAAVRRRLEESGAEHAKSLTLIDLSHTERAAIADILGASEVPAAGARLSLARLDAALRASAVAASLVDVIEALFDAPLADRRRERETVKAARAALWNEARARLATRPELCSWLDDLRTSGLVKRFATAEQCSDADILDAAIRIAMALPARNVLLAVLAAELTGDAHALDHGRGLGAAVLRAAAHIVGQQTLPTSAAERRQLWQAVGVLVDPVSNDVLTLGLRPNGTSLLARHLRESSDAGEPRRVTLRELLNAQSGYSSGAFADTEVVYVCENPSVLATAADRIGATSRALVCIDGVPTSAALELLAAAQRSGARILARADFDWPGIRIINLLRSRIAGIETWRFDAPTYTLLAHTGVEPLGSREPRLAASWDASLVPAMADVGRCVFEEHVVDALLDDLQGTGT